MFALGLVKEQRLRLGCSLRCAPGGKKQRQSALPRCVTKLIEPPLLDLGERSIDELVQRMVVPQRQGLVEQAKAIVIGDVAGGSQEALEPAEVDVVGINGQSIPAGLGDQMGAHRQRTAQTGHLCAQRARRIVGAVVGPQLLDQPIGGDGTVCFQEQDHEHAALTAAAKCDRTAVIEQLDRAEDPKARCSCDDLVLHTAILPPAQVPRCFYRTDETRR